MKALAEAQSDYVKNNYYKSVDEAEGSFHNGLFKTKLLLALEAKNESVVEGDSVKTTRSDASTVAYGHK